MTHLPDINIWLALAFSSHKHHKPAAEWFGNLSAETCVVCRMTQQGFLRLTTNQKAFKSDTCTMAEAWELYGSVMSDERVSFHPEPPGIEMEWRTLTQKETYSTKVWNDAFLAAFAKRASLKLVTFDRDFREFPGLDLEVLE